MFDFGSEFECWTVTSFLNAPLCCGSLLGQCLWHLLEMGFISCISLIPNTPILVGLASGARGCCFPSAAQLFNNPWPLADFPYKVSGQKPELSCPGEAMILKHQLKIWVDGVKPRKTYSMWPHWEEQIKGPVTFTSIFRALIAFALNKKLW